MPVTVTLDLSGLQLFKGKLRALDGLKFGVGIQGIEGAQSVAFDKDSGESQMNMATLATVLEFGRPAKPKQPAIPARPALERTATENTGAIAAALGDAIRVYMAAPRTGDTKRVAAKFMRPAGSKFARMMSAQFSSSRSWAAKNAKATVKRKGFDFPLVETGKLRKSITYTVRDRNDRVIEKGNRNG